MNYRLIFLFTDIQIIFLKREVDTKGGMKLNGNLLYTILPIKQAKQYFFKRLLENFDRAMAEDKRRKRIEKLNLKPNKQAV